MDKIYEITIEDISDKAEGIGRIDGKVCFVPYTLPGDVVEVTITEDRGNFYKARLLNEPLVKCGGAPLIRMDYEDQLKWKEKRVRDCLEKIAGISNVNLKNIIRCDNIYNYRNKGEFRLTEGFPNCNLECEDCPIQSKKSMEVLKHFKAAPRKNAKQLIVRTSKDGKVIAYTIQNNGYSLLYEGEKAFTDSIGNLQIEVDPFSFYQVNSLQCEKLYSKVKSYVKDGDSMLDLYCGAGTIGLFCSDKCKRVIGVEVVHEAILQANKNAIHNHIVNATFIEGKAEDVVKDKLQGVKADVVVLDPPRAGCKQSLLETVAEIAPERLVYVSCNPSTLARDVKILQGFGFTLSEATPVDMFPHTVSVETVALLSEIS